MTNKLLSNGPGIDYARGLANIDPKTGIRYGVVNLHNVSSFFLDEFEPNYPECDDIHDETAEPTSYFYDTEDLKCEYSVDELCLWVLYSKQTKKCKFCSPCVPGAGDLDSPCVDGIEAYCLPDDCLYNDKIE